MVLSVLTIPAWIWAGAAITAIPVLAVVLVIIRELTRPRPIILHQSQGTRVELWAGHPRYPAYSDVVVVPVSTDLKLIAGSALWVRGVTAGMAQRQADNLAPREPGDAVLVPGSRGRFRHTALAVVMDDLKRWDPAWIAQSVQKAVALARAEGVSSILIPDWTPDLMTQPRVQDDAFRRQQGDIVAPAVSAAIRQLIGEVPVVRLWVRDPAVVESYRQAWANVSRTPHSVAA